MESLWVGSDVDLSTLRLCRMADKLEFRLSCIRHNKNSNSFCETSMSNHCNLEQCGDNVRRRRRSGTWPGKSTEMESGGTNYNRCVSLMDEQDFRRTRSLNAPSPIQQFGPCGRIMKNSAMVMYVDLFDL